MTTQPYYAANLDNGIIHTLPNEDTLIAFAYLNPTVAVMVNEATLLNSKLSTADLIAFHDMKAEDPLPSDLNRWDVCKAVWAMVQERAPNPPAPDSVAMTTLLRKAALTVELAKREKLSAETESSIDNANQPDKPAIAETTETDVNMGSAVSVKATKKDRKLARVSPAQTERSIASDVGAIDPTIDVTEQGMEISMIDANVDYTNDEITVTGATVASDNVADNIDADMDAAGEPDAGPLDLATARANAKAKVEAIKASTKAAIQEARAAKASAKPKIAKTDRVAARIAALEAETAERIAKIERSAAIALARLNGEAVEGAEKRPRRNHDSRLVVIERGAMRRSGRQLQPAGSALLDAISAAGANGMRYGDFLAAHGSSLSALKSLEAGGRVRVLPGVAAGSIAAPVGAADAATMADVIENADAVGDASETVVVAVETVG